MVISVLLSITACSGPLKPGIYNQHIAKLDVKIELSRLFETNFDINSQYNQPFAHPIMKSRKDDIIGYETHFVSSKTQNKADQHNFVIEVFHFRTATKGVKAYNEIYSSIKDRKSSEKEKQANHLVFISRNKIFQMGASCKEGILLKSWFETVRVALIPQKELTPKSMIRNTCGW